MDDVTWNPWHGCHKLSAGCQNCYVYRMDTKHDRDASKVYKTGEFDLPLRKTRQKEYKIPSGTTVYTCFTSDFLLQDADEWRAEAWAMMRERRDLKFMFITKRIDRLEECLPSDWHEFYQNVTIGCTCENQQMADQRLPVFLKMPVASRIIICEPLLGPIDVSRYLGAGIDMLVAGGESGTEARPCDFEWVKALRAQCVAANVRFNFRQTGARLIKDGRLYRIERRYQFSQARKANMEYCPKRVDCAPNGHNETGEHEEGRYDGC